MGGSHSTTVKVASSLGGINDRLVLTVMRMRLIFLMNIHKTIAWVVLVSSGVVNGVESRLPVML